MARGPGLEFVFDAQAGLAEQLLFSPLGKLLKALKKLYSDICKTECKSETHYDNISTPQAQHAPSRYYSVQTQTHTHTHAHTHARTHSRTHARTHARTHTRTQSNLSQCFTSPLNVGTTCYSSTNVNVKKFTTISKLKKLFRNKTLNCYELEQ